MGSGSRYVWLYFYLHSYFQVLLLLFCVASREAHTHAGVRLSPRFVPAARLPEQQQCVKETGTVSGGPALDPGSPPGLPGPVHLHTPAPLAQAPVLLPCPKVVARAVVNK